jgi:GrpB-like predicted nucleotidyltransferase (UPF0157 family)
VIDCATKMVVGWPMVLRIRGSDWLQHRLFNGPDTPFNLHVFGRGAGEITRMVQFRHRLRSVPEDRHLLCADQDHPRCPDLALSSTPTGIAT